MTQTIVSESQTCWACPTQFEGELSDGQHFYFRYRHSLVQIGVGDSHDAAVEHAMTYVYADRTELDGDDCGVMSYEQYRADMAAFLEELAATDWYIEEQLAKAVGA